LRLLAAGVASCTILAVGAILAPHPRIVWNATASAPRGLYLLTDRRAKRGDLVLVATPLGIRQLAAERGYVPANVPLVKRIAAEQGDRVCSTGNSISINGILVAVRRARDGQSRILPRWSGCRRLSAGDIFLLMMDVPSSFDGRYFGVTPRTAVLGRLVPLWTE
jgi:conjugative transfer signal peptidase TraF